MESNSKLKLLVALVLANAEFAEPQMVPQYMYYAYAGSNCSNDADCPYQYYQCCAQMQYPSADSNGATLQTTQQCWYAFASGFPVQIVSYTSNYDYYLQPAAGFCMGNSGGMCAVDSDCSGYYDECRVLIRAIDQYVYSSQCINEMVYSYNPFTFFPNSGSIVYNGNQFFTLTVQNASEPLVECTTHYDCQKYENFFMPQVPCCAGIYISNGNGGDSLMYK